MKQTHFLQIAAYYPPHLGGLEVVAQEVAEQLSKEGHTVTVLTSDIGAEHLPKLETKQNLSVRRLWAFEFAHTAFIPALPFRLFFVPKPSIFHLHLSQAVTADIVWMVAKLRGIPYVVHFHLDVDRTGPLGFIFEWWKKYMQPIIIRGAAKVITLSHDQTKLIHERYNVPLEKIEFIGNGVSETFLAIGKNPRSIHHPVRLLYVGRLSPQKRVERIVEAMASITSRATLTIVGDGEDKPKLISLVKKLGLSNVTFAGRLDGERLLDAYRRNDVFLLPSDKEGMPLVALEAMATGLPIIGSDVLGITELIQGVGILVPDPSAQSFARAIDDVVRDSEKLMRMSRASYEHAKKFSWSKLIEKLSAVYREIRQ